MSDKDIIERLNRLEMQARVAKETIQLERRDARFVVNETPNTFEVGDFIVTDRQWTKCGPRGCTPPPQVNE